MHHRTIVQNAARAHIDSGNETYTCEQAAADYRAIGYPPIEQFIDVDEFARMVREEISALRLGWVSSPVMSDPWFDIGGESA